MAVPKPKRVGAKIYHLIVYVDNGLASNEILHGHAKRCWHFQAANARHDEQMAARGYCPCGNVNSSQEEDDGA